jgi:putative phosphoesterase
MSNSSVLIISDSHGNVPALTAVLSWAQAPSGISPSAFIAAIFLGDGENDLGPASAQTGFALPWYKVQGNGDHGFSTPASMILEIPQSKTGKEANFGLSSRNPDTSSSRKIFLTHGNHYRVETGYEALASAAHANGAEAALFGHTHVPFCATLDGIFLLNPGSIDRPRSRIGPSFAVLDCPPSGPLSARFYQLVPRGKKLLIQELPNAAVSGVHNS